jgi:hypothetical protein
MKTLSQNPFVTSENGYSYDIKRILKGHNELGKGPQKSSSN